MIVHSIEVCHFFGGCTYALNSVLQWRAGFRLSWASLRGPPVEMQAGGGVPSCDHPNTSRGLAINTFRVGDETLAACFVTYSIHQSVLSAFCFDAPLRAHYNSLPRRYFLIKTIKHEIIMSTAGPSKSSGPWAPGRPPPPS